MNLVKSKRRVAAHLGKREVFTPEKTYPSMTVSELAAGASA